MLAMTTSSNDKGTMNTLISNQDQETIATSSKEFFMFTRI